VKIQGNNDILRICGEMDRGSGSSVILWSGLIVTTHYTREGDQKIDEYF